MIDIIPKNTNLGDISEREHFVINFSVEIDEDPSTSINVVELKIIEFDSNIGVDIKDAVISGEYRDSFSLGEESIKYITKDLIKKTAGSFDDLPDPKTADLYSFDAPSKLVKDYHYTVYLKYTKTTQSETSRIENTDKPLFTEHELTKKYTHRVFGNWDVWAEQLRNYVKMGV